MHACTHIWLAFSKENECPTATTCEVEVIMGSSGEGKGLCYTKKQQTAFLTRIFYSIFGWAYLSLIFLDRFSSDRWKMIITFFPTSVPSFDKRIYCRLFGIFWRRLRPTRRALTYIRQCYYSIVIRTGIKEDVENEFGEWVAVIMQLCR